MTEIVSMRDALIGRIYEIAKEDEDVIFLSADMGAPALDKVRSELASQFINVGIAEENLIAVASGLALEGKKVFVFAIAPFVTSRCHEFIKINASLMGIPIKIIGVGAGFGYDDSGPTHHTTEDIAIMNALPNLEILSPSDSVMARACADLAYNSKKPVYIRLDRQVLPRIYTESSSFEGGFKELKIGKDLCIITTGNMVHNAIEIGSRFEKQGKFIGLIDLYRIKPIDHRLLEALKKYNKVVTIEEHLLPGGIGSIISELITDNDLRIKLKRFGLKDYIYAYGGRNNIQKICGIGCDCLETELDRELKTF